MTIQLLDAEGDEVASAEKVFDNEDIRLFGGESPITMNEDIPFFGEGPMTMVDLHVPFGRVTGISRATRFRVEIEILPARQPASAD